MAQCSLGENRAATVLKISLDYSKFKLRCCCVRYLVKHSKSIVESGGAQYWMTKCTQGRALCEVEVDTILDGKLMLMLLRSLGYISAIFEAL